MPAPDRPATDRAHVALVGLALIGLVLAGYGLVRLVRASETLGWRATDGQVMWSRIKVVQKMRGGLLSFHYGPDVHYRYTVGGREHQAARYAARRWLSPEVRLANALVQRYAAGDAVRVYYDPAQPKHAVLQPGFARPDTATSSVGVLAMVFLATAGLGGLARLRSPAPPGPAARGPAPPAR